MNWKVLERLQGLLLLEVCSWAILKAPHIAELAGNRTNAFFPNISVGVVSVEENHLASVPDEGLRLGQINILAVDVHRHCGDDVEAKDSDDVLSVIQATKSVWKT